MWPRTNGWAPFLPSSSAATVVYKIMVLDDLHVKIRRDPMPDLAATEIGGSRSPDPSEAGTWLQNWAQPFVSIYLRTNTILADLFGEALGLIGDFLGFVWPKTTGGPIDGLGR